MIWSSSQRANLFLEAKDSYLHHPDVVGGFIENVAPSLEDLAGLRSREDG